jgi:acyl-CoA synthetase (AMP-forming)/AMP-acid ligase II
MRTRFPVYRELDAHGVHAMRGLRLHDFLDYWARRQPSVEFAVQGDRCLTYREAQAVANRLANALLATGLKGGDRIAVLAKNCVEYPLVYLAASKVGVVPVPLNYRSASDEWATIVEDAGAKLLIVGAGYVSAVEAIRSRLGSVVRLVGLSRSETPAGWTSFEAWIGEQPDEAPDDIVGEDDDLYQLYTSGTTGQPKGAVLTQRAVVANLVQLGLCAHRGAPGARSLVIGPMLHAGVVWSTLAPLSWGASLYIVEDFEAGEVVRILREERIDYASLVPTILNTILASVPDVAAREYPTLRLIHTGSSPISEQTLLGAREAFRCDVVHGYGLTESTAALTVMAPDDYGRAGAGQPGLLLSAGRPLVGTELRILDGDGQSLPPGGVGEIVARGPQLMRGYWRQPAATAEVLRDGWLHTGDIGALDAEGYLFIQDRLKDVIVTGGLKVYPRMVEAVLLAHPAVAEVAVVGVPDARWGETVQAIVVARPGTSATERELTDFCRDRLGGFQCPRGVSFVDTLPRTATGKVLKRQLREAFWSGQDRQVGGA